MGHESLAGPRDLPGRGAQHGPFLASRHAATGCGAVRVAAILAAIELVEDDRALLDVAALYARALQARLYLVHVMPPEPDFVGLPKEAEANPAGPDDDAPVGYAYDRGVAADRARAAHDELHALRDRLAAAGLTTTALLIEGPSAEKIAAEARRLDCGLIVVGAHQRGLLGTWLHGSTSRELLRDAPCPVLVVPVAG
jgi:nucleotide-binding universal stress UspA family protein